MMFPEPVFTGSYNVVILLLCLEDGILIFSERSVLFFSYHQPGFIDRCITHSQITSGLAQWLLL